MKPTQIAKDGQASEASLESLRASIPFNPDTSQAPRAIVVPRKVSTAGVVRDAAEQWIAGKWPLSARAAI